ncbi:MAG: hypothetical protein ACKOWO_05315 [Sediminibacterium sp.]
MKIVSYSLVFLILAYQSIFAQLQVEFSYSIGPSATFAKTLKTTNMTWGYSTPPLPHMGVQQLNIGFGTAKNKLSLAYDWGEIGPNLLLIAYPNKYPLDDTPDIGSNITNLSTATAISGNSYSASHLSQFSLDYKHLWKEKNKFQHSSIIGMGVIKTRTANGGAHFGSLEYIDSLGNVSHGFVAEPYHYIRLYNVYAIAGYKVSYVLNPHWKINAQVMYHQGLAKMIWWHSYRYYSESSTGYTEFDEQWSYTRLSYVSLLGGISYIIFRDPLNQKRK